jgi:hypothetical protein
LVDTKFWQLNFEQLLDSRRIPEFMHIQVFLNSLNINLCYLGDLNLSIHSFIKSMKIGTPWIIMN